MSAVFGSGMDVSERCDEVFPRIGKHISAKALGFFYDREDMVVTRHIRNLART
jgi:hypothetical protein